MTSYRVHHEGVARYGFPYVDFRRVYRSALIHAKARAAQNDHDDMVAVADELLRHLDAVRR